MSPEKLPRGLDTLKRKISSIVTALAIASLNSACAGSQRPKSSSETVVTAEPTANDRNQFLNEADKKPWEIMEEIVAQVKKSENPQKEVNPAQNIEESFFIVSGPIEDKMREILLENANKIEGLKGTGKTFTFQLKIPGVGTFDLIVGWEENPAKEYEKSCRLSPNSIIPPLKMERVQRLIERLNFTEGSMQIQDGTFTVREKKFQRGRTTYVFGFKDSRNIEWIAEYVYPENFNQRQKRITWKNIRFQSSNYHQIQSGSSVNVGCE